MNSLAGTGQPSVSVEDQPSYSISDAEDAHLWLLCEALAASEGYPKGLTYDDAGLDTGQPAMHIHSPERNEVVRTIYKRRQGWHLCKYDDSIILGAPTLMGLLRLATSSTFPFAPI